MHSFFAGLNEASEPSTSAHDPQDLAMDLGAMDIDTESETPPQLIPIDTNDPPTYSYWAGYKKCPSPARLGKSLSPKSKPKERGEMYFTRRRKSSTYSATYLEQSMEYEKEEEEKAFILHMIKQMMSSSLWLHEAQFPQLAVDLGVLVTEDDTRETFTQKVLDLLEKDDEDRIYACQYCDLDDFVNLQSLDAHRKQVHQILSDDQQTVLEATSDGDSQNSATVDLPPNEGVEEPIQDHMVVFGLVQFYIGQNKTNNDNLDLIHNELLLELLGILDDNSAESEHAVLTEHNPQFWKMKKDLPTENYFDYINQKDYQELAKDFLEYVPSNEEIKKDLIEKANDNFLLELAIKGLAISNKKRIFLYFKKHLEPLDRSGRLELAAQKANEPVKDMPDGKLIDFLCEKYQAETLTWSKYKSDNEVYKNAILRIVYHKGWTVKQLATLIASSCLPKHYSLEDVEYLIKTMAIDNDQVKEIILAEQLNNLHEDELHEILIGKLAHPEIQQLSIDSMKQKILEYCMADVENHAIVSATLQEMFPEKSDDDREDEYIFENVDQGSDGSEDEQMENEFDSDDDEDNYFDMDNDDITDMDKNAQILSFKNLMRKCTIKKLISIGNEFNLEIQEIDTSTSIGLIDTILNHCLESDDKMKQLVELLSAKDSDNEFTKSQYRDQIEHLKLVNLRKLYHILADRNMDPNSDDLNKELEKDRSLSFHDVLNQLRLKEITPIAEHFGINLGKAKQVIKKRAVKKVVEAAKANKSIESTIRDYMNSYKINKEARKNELMVMEPSELVELCKTNEIKIKKIDNVRPIRLKSVLLDDYLSKRCNFPRYLDLVERTKEAISDAVMKSEMSPNDLAKIIMSKILLEECESTTPVPETINQTKSNEQKEKKKDKLLERIARYEERKKCQLQDVLKYLDRDILVDTMNAISGNHDMILELSNEDIRKYLIEYGSRSTQLFTTLMNAIIYMYREHGDINYSPTDISHDEAIARRLNIPITNSNEPLSDLIKQMEKEYSISNEVMVRIKTSIGVPPQFALAPFETQGIKFKNVAGTPDQNRSVQKTNM